MSLGTMYPLLFNIAETVLYTRNNLDASGVSPPLRAGADGTPSLASSISISPATMILLLSLDLYGLDVMLLGVFIIVWLLPANCSLPWLQVAWIGLNESHPRRPQATSRDHPLLLFVGCSDFTTLCTKYVDGQTISLHNLLPSETVSISLPLLKLANFQCSQVSTLASSFSYFRGHRFLIILFSLLFRVKK